MSIPVIGPVEAASRPVPGFRSLRHVELERLGPAGSPVLMLDDFVVAEATFSPHPHAGFAAVTYVFEDSATGLRSRASLADDAVVGPGGIVWTEAGRGIIHEELPVEVGQDLHGVQVFVNLSAANQLAPPRVLVLDGPEVPVWRGSDGDEVRVVVGSFQDVASPLDPIEPFTLLDVDLRSSLPLEVPAGHSHVVYAADAVLEVAGPDPTPPTALGPWQAMALRGGTATVTAIRPGRLVVLGGPDIPDPVVVEGSFIMSDHQQIVDAVHRYRTGAMGHLEATRR